MSVGADILRSYRAPGEALRNRLAAASEGSTLATLMVSCLLLFVAQWPRLAREAHLEPDIPLDARIGAALFGFMFLLPLICYLISAVLWIIFRTIGSGISGLSVRVAFFWSLLAATPAWLAFGFFSGFLGAGPALDAIGFIALVLYLWILIGGMREALRIGRRV